MEVPSKRIQEEQIISVYQNCPLTLVGTMVVTGSAYWLLSSVEEVANHIELWTGAAVALFLLRVVLLRAWRKSGVQGDIRWAHFECGAGLLVGLLWSYMTFLVVPTTDVIALSNLGVLVTGMIAGSMITQATYLPVFFWFAAPLMGISTAITYLLSPAHSYLAFFTFVFSTLCVWFTLKISRAQTETIRQRLFNELLLDELSIEKQKVEDANRAIYNFFAAASHDLRQPVHALSLYIGSMDPTSAQAGVIGRMKSAISNLQSLYDRVLDISKLEAGEIDVDLQSIAVSNFISEIVERHRYSADDKHLNLTFTGEDLYVKSDPVLLGRIIDNLLTNAIKFTDTGSVTVSVVLANNHCIVRIEDTGPGIRTTDIDKIFDPYVQLEDGPKKEDQSTGFGLGLSIVRSLAHLLHHQVSVDSHIGDGTTFSLKLESADAPSVTERIEPIRSEEDADGNILVIDDDSSIREATTNILTKWGYRVRQVQTWQQLTEDQQPVDLIVSDYKIWQGHTGHEAIKLVRDRVCQNVPAILITGSSDTKVKAISEEMQIPLLMKPLKPAQLRSAVQRMLSKTSNINEI